MKTIDLIGFFQDFCNSQKRSETVLCILRIRRLGVRVPPDAPMISTRGPAFVFCFATTTVIFRVVFKKQICGGKTALAKNVACLPKSRRRAAECSGIFDAA